MNPGLTLILGRRGEGKTTRMVLEVCRSLQQGRHDVVAFDPLAQFGLRVRRVWAGWGAHYINIVHTVEGWDGALIPHGAVVVLDEVDLLVRSPRLVSVVNFGRVWDVDVYACARRPARITRDVSALATRIILYRITEPRDLGWVREYAGAEYADRVQRLGPHQSIEWRG